MTEQIRKTCIVRTSYNIIRINVCYEELNCHLLIVKLLGRNFKIINLATLEASLRSKKQNLKIFNVLNQRTPDAMQNNGLAQIDANDRDLDRR